MLESNHQERLNTALTKLDCQVELPNKWVRFFSRRGALTELQDDRRQFSRYHHPAKAVLKLDQSLPAIPRADELFSVVTKDISRGGINFLHAQQLFPAERVRFWLATGIFDATVRWCVRHNEHCYEIGAVFGEETN